MTLPFPDIGAGWTWALLGLVLAVGEALAPGIFLIWFGIAALATAAVVAAVALAWPFQVLLFALLALLFAVAGRRLTRHDGSNLNRRGHDLVGRSFALESPIMAGTGRWHQGDTSWRLAGPDLPAGARVRVVRLDGATLIVEAAPDQP